MLSKNSKVLIEAYDKGYRVVDGKAISPFTGKELKTTMKGSAPEHLYHRFSCGALGNKRKDVYIHRLVAYQKYGDVIFNKNIQVRHLNGDSLDNSENNIAIGSQSDNSMDKCPKVRMKAAITASNKIRKFTDLEMEEIRQYKKNNMAGYKDVMEEFNISSKGTLHYILHNNYVTTKK